MVAGGLFSPTGKSMGIGQVPEDVDVDCVRLDQAFESHDRLLRKISSAFHIAARCKNGPFQDPGFRARSLPIQIVRIVVCQRIERRYHIVSEVRGPIELTDNRSNFDDPLYSVRLIVLPLPIVRVCQRQIVRLLGTLLVEIERSR